MPEKSPRLIEPLTHADGLCRCPWPGTDPLYVAYHDEEWGAPEWDDRALFEKLILDGFQAGLSWITILRKREAFRAAFDGFDPEKIARYGERKFEALMADPGIVRNRAKIEAAPALARASSSICRRRAASRAISGASSTAGRSSTARARRSPTFPRETAEAEALSKDLKAARRQFRRPDDRLRLHAGGRHGQRPSRRLPPPRGLRRPRRAPPW